MASAMRLDITHERHDVARLHISGIADPSGAAVVAAALCELEASGAETIVLTGDPSRMPGSVRSAIDGLRERLERQGRRVLMMEPGMAETAPAFSLRQIGQRAG
ncbi:MAG TPA: hypothetical protein VM840_04225 [Actinomycetota bacterium]|nr:hypothetical protein [Actinomycetota bacterium]